jgi:hypothetical protein
VFDLGFGATPDFLTNGAARSGLDADVCGSIRMLKKAAGCGAATTIN